MNNNGIKHLVLCADDFGIAPGVNRAIFDLIEAGRLSATSCMTSMPYWSEGAAKLKGLADRIQIGLHVTLTDQMSLAAMPNLAPNRRLPNIRNLLKLSVTRHLDYDEIYAEIHRQYDVFCQTMGKPPDFIDGHHHVHQFPVIRNAVIELIRREQNSYFLWVRLCWESPARLISRRESIGRALSIGVFGLGLRRLANAHGISYNNGFTGVYDYRKKLMNEELMSRLLHKAIGQTVMFCHPGYVDEQLTNVDELTDAREIEYKFFRSTEFQNVLTRAGFTLF